MSEYILASPYSLLSHSLSPFSTFPPKRRSLERKCNLIWAAMNKIRLRTSSRFVSTSPIFSSSSPIPPFQHIDRALFPSFCLSPSQFPSKERNKSIRRKGKKLEKKSNLAGCGQTIGLRTQYPSSSSLHLP